MTYRVCEHLQIGATGKHLGTRNVLLLSKEGERVLCCCDCYDDRHGAALFTIPKAYFDARVTEFSLYQKSKQVS